MNRGLRGDIVIAAVLLAAATALAVLGWVDAVHAYLLAAFAIAVTLGWRRGGGGAEAEWPRPPDEHRAGARYDVSELAWATLTRNGTVSGRVMRRVRAVAEDRLAMRGIDLAEPAHRSEAERLLGAEVVEGLVARREPTPHTLHTWLDAIERIAPTDGRHHG